MKNVIIQALTESEWDTVGGLLISVYELKRILKTAEEMKPKLKAMDMYKGESMSVNAAFICLPDELEEVDLEKEVLQTMQDEDFFSEPESRMGSVTVCYYAHASPTIKAEGKHTGEEFWADLGTDAIKRFYQPINKTNMNADFHQHIPNADDVQMTISINGSGSRKEIYQALLSMASQFGALTHEETLEGGEIEDNILIMNFEEGNNNS